MYLKKYEGHEFTVTNKNSYGAIPLDFEPEFGKPYFLLTAMYQTGDTFQTSSGNVDDIFLYDDAVTAKAALDIVRAHAQKYEDLNRWNVKKTPEDLKFDAHSVEIPDNNGSTFKVSATWNGYFESLESIEIKTLFRKVE